jgi:hypothetical protein
VAPPFASGVVFLSAMLDRLTVQCFYNRDLLNILQARVLQHTTLFVFKINSFVSVIAYLQAGPGLGESIHAILFGIV